MTDDEKRAAGKLFWPGDPALKAMKLRSHKLCAQFSRTDEDETETRAALIAQILADFGPGSFLQGPIFFHYGCHTHIGARFFGNYNLTVQDDAEVVIGDDCNFGPNVTIVTPVHPMLPDERRALRDDTGTDRHLCYAKPVKIGNDCWLGANVLVCPGVTIGDGCVIGAGSVVTRDIPPMLFAAGDPARVIRPITDADRMANHPELFAE